MRLFNKVNVKVSDTAIGLIYLKKRLYLAQCLLSDVRRISNDRVKSRIVLFPSVLVTEDFGELYLPMEEPLLRRYPLGSAIEGQAFKGIGISGVEGIQGLMIVRLGHIVSEVNAGPKVRHAFVKTEHLLGDVQLAFFRVDLISGAALGLLNQQVVSNGGGNPIGEREFHLKFCLSFAGAAASPQFR